MPDGALAALLDRLPAPLRRRPNPDVAGLDLDELERRLGAHAIAFQLSSGGWSACSTVGEHRAHGETLGEVVAGVLEQLPA